MSIYLDVMPNAMKKLRRLSVNSIWKLKKQTKSSAETVLQLLCLMHFTCLLMKIYNREILKKVHKNIDAKAKELKKFLSKYCHVPVLLITN